MTSILRRLDPRPTRRALLRAGVAAGGAGLAAGFLGGRGIVAAATSDPDVLTNLVVLEDQAVSLYGALVATVAPPATSSAASSSSSGPAAPVDPRVAIQGATQLHMDHRDLLVQALANAGGTPPPVGLTYVGVVPASTSVAADVLAALATAEATLLGAMYGAFTALSDPARRAAVATMYAPTARLQALLLSALAQPPVPASFVTGTPDAATAVSTPGSAAAGGLARR